MNAGKTEVQASKDYRNENDGDPGEDHPPDGSLLEEREDLVGQPEGSAGGQGNDPHVFALAALGQEQHQSGNAETEGKQVV